MTDYSSSFSPLAAPSTSWKSHVELTFTPQEPTALKNLDSPKPVFKEKIEPPSQIATEPELQKISDEMTEADQAYQLMMEIRGKLETAFKTLEKQIDPK